MHHVVEADPSRSHRVGIELDLKLPEVAAEPLDGRNTGHREQAVVDVEFGEVA